MANSKLLAYLQLSGIVIFFLAFLLFGPIYIRLWFGLSIMVLGIFLICSFTLRRLHKGDMRKLDECAPGGNNDEKAINLEYRRLMIKLTLIWLSLCAITLYSYCSLHFGLGKDWFPFARTISIKKGDPLFGYTIFDGPLLIFGFLAISGIAWLPMYFLFEGILASKKVKELKQKGATHA